MQLLERHVERKWTSPRREEEKSDAEYLGMLDQSQRSEYDHTREPDDTERRRRRARECSIDEAEGDRNLRRAEETGEKIDGQHEIGHEELPADPAHEKCDAHVNANYERHPHEKLHIVFPRHPERQRARHHGPSSARPPDYHRHGRDSDGDIHWNQSMRPGPP